MCPYEGIRVIDATHVLAGPMAMTGTPNVNPIEIGVPAVDYATGTTGAFALAAALLQGERTGQGQHIDLVMLDVALILAGSHLANYLTTGKASKPSGNEHPYATSGCYAAKEGLLMLGASNLRRQRRLWRVLGREDMAKRTNEEREAARGQESAVLAELLFERAAAEWEEHLQARHVPTARVRTLGEAPADPHLASRNVLHRFTAAPGIVKGFTVPVAAFRFAHGGPEVTNAPRPTGRHTSGVLGELGYNETEIAALAASGAIGRIEQ